MKKQLAVFASGTGTNFDAIARACADGVLDASEADKAITILKDRGEKAAVIGQVTDKPGVDIQMSF